MTRRLRAPERLTWRGWEFQQSQATQSEVHWQLHTGELRIRLIYRNIQDPEAPASYLAIIKMHGLEEGTGEHVAGSAEDPSPELALALAERDFERKLVNAVRVLSVLRRGKQAPSTKKGERLLAEFEVPFGEDARKGCETVP